MSAIQITIKSIQNSPSINYHINKHFYKLNETYPGITHCHVTVDTPKNHSVKERLYKVNVDVIIPGMGLINSHKSNEHLFLAIHNCFQALEKLVQKSVKSKKKIRKKYFVPKAPPMTGYNHLASC